MNKKFSYKQVLFLLLFIFSGMPLCSQYLVTDTTFIDFKPDSIIPVSFHLKSIRDNRNVNPKFVSFTTKKKLLIIPVDDEICFRNKLSEVLKAGAVPQSGIVDTFDIDVEQFVVEKFKGRFTSFYQLKADFNILNRDSTAMLLSYTYPYRPRKKKTPMPEITQSVIENWYREFKIDMNQVVQYQRQPEKNLPPNNLIEEELKRNFFFTPTVGAVAGLNFWQLEGEMYFTRPETGGKQFSHAGIIRYQNTPDFEMIGFGRKSEHLHKRVNDNFLFDVSTNLLLGINKWRKPDDVELLQIVQLSFSSNQSLNFDRKNQPGFIFKTGLFENVYYIYNKPLQFQVGIYLSLGYKF